MTRTERCYLSGPMTGLPDYNYPLFHAVARDLRRQGYEVVNPAENFGGDTRRHRHDYFRADLPQVAACGNLVLLPGWRASRGVRWELVVADACGLRVFEAEQKRQFVAHFFSGHLECREAWFVGRRLSAAEVRDYTRFEQDPSYYETGR